MIIETIIEMKNNEDEMIIEKGSTLNNKRKEKKNNVIEMNKKDTNTSDNNNKITSKDAKEMIEFNDMGDKDKKNLDWIKGNSFHLFCVTYSRFNNNLISNLKNIILTLNGNIDYKLTTNTTYLITDDPSDAQVNHL
jgi:hypothetical protein